LRAVKKNSRDDSLDSEFTELADVNTARLQGAS